MSGSSELNGGAELLQRAAAAIDELATARLDALEFLTAAITTLSELRPGTWVAVLMTKDPSSSLVISADNDHRSMARYVDDLVTAHDRRGRAPTSSLSLHVIETGRQLFLPDLPFDDFLSMLTPFERAYIDEHPLPVDLESLGLLIVPMRSRGATIGTLGLFNQDGSHPITQQDAMWIQTAADRLGLAVEGSQLYHDAIQRLERLSSLQIISRAIAANSDLTFTLKTVLEQLTLRLKVDAADVLLIDESDGMLTLAASTGFVATAVSDFRLPVNEGLPWRALKSLHTETLTAPSEFSQFRRRSLFAREGFRTYSAVPLATGEKLVGVIEVFHRTLLSPDEEALSFLDALASIATIAVDLAALHKQLQTSALSTPRKIHVKAPQLSKVEWDILRLLVEGHTNLQISSQVRLSQNTIKFHVRQMLQKSGATNRTDLTRQAMSEGWLS